MNAARRAAVLLAERIETATAAFGRRVSLDPQAVLDRSGDIVLGEPGATSPNGHCRILAAADGWVALNLARRADADLCSLVGAGIFVPGKSGFSEVAARVRAVRQRRTLYLREIAFQVGT